MSGWNTMKAIAALWARVWNIRKPGSMAGEIWVAPDFDTLPEDIADAFGAVSGRE